MINKLNLLALKKICTPLIFFVFTAIFSSISLVNHYLFRTFAYDLGLNNNAIFDYSHFRWNDCMLMQPQFDNILSDHLTLLPLLASPLVWLLGTYTMLVVQIAGILFGGLGIYKFILYKTQNTVLAQLALIHFFSFWGIYSALAFDYHDNVLGAMFVPWIFLYFYKKNNFALGFFVVLLLISKENMALWAVFIGLGLALLEYKNRDLILKGLFISIISLAYFIIAIKVIIPILANNDRSYIHFHFSALGQNFEQALITILTSPFYAFKMLFINHLEDSNIDFVKLELHAMLLLAGAYCFFWKPQYLIMLIPIYGQKLYNDDFLKWGLNYHYSIEFAPILSIALFLFFHQKKVSVKWILIAVAITLVSNILSIEYRTPKWNKELINFYDKAHYTTVYDAAKMHHALKLIPQESNVSAHSALVPHLAFREEIILFPYVENKTNTIALLNDGRTYPLSNEEFKKALTKLQNDSLWKNVCHEDCLYIFKKK